MKTFGFCISITAKIVVNLLLALTCILQDLMHEGLEKLLITRRIGQQQQGPLALFIQSRFLSPCILMRLRSTRLGFLPRVRVPIT